MGLFSKIKDFLRGTIYRINREVLADYMNNEIQFSVENNLSACGEFYLSPSEGETEEHIIITNNDAPCKMSDGVRERFYRHYDLRQQKFILRS